MRRHRPERLEVDSECTGPNRELLCQGLALANCWNASTAYASNCRTRHMGLWRSFSKHDPLIMGVSENTWLPGGVGCASSLER